MKNIAIIGSSGSIGRQALSVVRRHPDKFNVTALVVKSSTDLLSEQIAEFSPNFAGIYDEKASQDFFVPVDVNLVRGKEALTFACALEEVDIVVVAVSCMDGLAPVLTAIENDKLIALANKESIVAGGEIVLEKLAKSKAKILPVDSEHSAVWQILGDLKGRDVKRIILTASGGAFFGKDREFLKTVTPAQAIKHPNWSMGKKITVDSATMVNKGLEIIEAARLFSTKNIDYIIHPESIVHSMVEYNDGAVLAQMGVTSMELPIQYALTYPDRCDTGLKPMDFTRPITFFEPDEINFPAI
ncbi:MAG: 1-deoxy-D-xylulose-5-phosphate reductoisomerase [Clostridia bacterium]|nr:1-deoxy-D-xylulose-5-phosphate reductoisomerase [Clostridia bacterium]